jgi:hypothetical protein
MKEDRRAALGNGTAFSAAPSQRPGRRPSIQNIRERYSDHSPGPEYLDAYNILPLDQFRPHLGFCQPDPHCAASGHVAMAPASSVMNSRRFK